MEKELRDIKASNDTDPNAKHALEYVRERLSVSSQVIQEAQERLEEAESRVSLIENNLNYTKSILDNRLHALKDYSPEFIELPPDYSSVWDLPDKRLWLYKLEENFKEIRTAKMLLSRRNRMEQSSGHPHPP